jgi:hypothetical protein
MPRVHRCLPGLALLALGAFHSGAAHAAIVVTSSTDANALAAALTAGGTGITLIDATLSGQATGNGETSSGTYAITGPLPDTYGLVSGGIVLSTGDVRDYGTGPNTVSKNVWQYGVAASGAQEALLDPITGSFNHFDATQLDLTFDVDPDVDTIYFQVVFGSEEYPEFVGSFIDGFGLYLNGTNYAEVAGQAVNIDHPAMTAIAGTELDGVLAPNGEAVLTFALPVTPGSFNNLLTFIIADTVDSDADTTVYVTGFSSSLKSLFFDGFEGGAVPGPWDASTP